jgi:CheY-like chemotaxis protein/HPt (histidine-containing phosphotransfer) domain-containing protein
MLNARRTLPDILLIDDDLVSREVMATVLTMGGFSVHTAESGDASLALLTRGEVTPGLVLVDAQMPGLSGASLVEELRTRTQACIFAISASEPGAALSAACDGFLLKPFDDRQLTSLLERCQAGRVSASGADKPRPSSGETGPTPTAADSTAPIIDAKTLDELREVMSEDGVRKIYAALVSDLKRRHTALEGAFEKGDRAELRRIGHAIKGGCGMAGAAQAARLGAAIEGNQLDNKARILGDLASAIKNLERMLDSDFPL